MKPVKSFLVLLMSLTFNIASDESLKVLGGENGPPRFWLNDQGKPEGILADVLLEVEKRTGIDIVIELSPWKRALESSRKGYGAIAGFSKTVERQVLWDYSEPIYFEELIVVTRAKEAFDFTGNESLKRKNLSTRTRRDLWG